MNESIETQVVECDPSEMSATHESQCLVKDRQMLPSSPKRFQSREALLEYVQVLSFSQGYATTIKDSKKDKYVIIGCDRGGTYRNRVNVPFEERKRKSSSRLMNCPFEVRGNKQDDGSWILRAKTGEHNHEASEDMSKHPSFLRFPKEKLLRIKELAMTDMEPHQMMKLLSQAFPNLQAVESTAEEAERIRKQTEELRHKSEELRHKSEEMNSLIMQNVSSMSSLMAKINNLQDENADLHKKLKTATAQKDKISKKLVNENFELREALKIALTKLEQSNKVEQVSSELLEKLKAPCSASTSNVITDMLSLLSSPQNTEP